MAVHTYEITVIGGGPVGMFATFYAGLHNADVLLLESLSDLGGQTGNLYPAKTLYDIGGYPAIKGQELVNQLATQTSHFKPTIRTGTKVLTIERDEQSGYVLHTDTGDYHTKTVIVATGGGAFTPRALAVDYDPALNGHQVLYFIRDVEALRGLDIAIAGGGDSALDWALALLPIAKKVHLIHRRTQFRGLEASASALTASTAQLHLPYLISGLTRQGQKLQLTLKEVRGDHQETLIIDKLLVNYGFMSENKELRNWHLPLEHGLITVDSKMATNQPGIYAIGDVVTYPGKLKLIASGFGEAPIAVNEALTYLYPERRQALHSTQLYH